MKKFAFTLLLLSVLSALLLRGCVPKTSAHVIREFEREKNRFAAIAEYIERLEWEKYEMDAEDYFRFSDWSGYEPHITKAQVDIPKMDRHVKRYLRILFVWLRYAFVQRTTNTITFVKKSAMNWDHFYQGVCYVTDGGEPAPRFGWDDSVRVIVPIGDNWYYWNGQCYPG